MTWLAVSIPVEGEAQAVSAAARAAELGADLVEYRLDRMAERQAEAAALVRRSPLPCIATCRPLWEGGGFEGPEERRVELFERLAALPRPPLYIDLELAAWRRDAELRRRIARIVDAGGTNPTPREAGELETRSAELGTRPGLILSSHDYEGRPPDLLGRIAAMAEEDACRVIKVAWKARSLRDNLEALELAGSSPKPTIALCMGPFGLPSRVLAKKFGALLTFAALDDESATAPGQPPVAMMKRLYRWDAIGPRTRVYGVIGWPVAHSLSPLIHNAGFEQVGHDGVYLPMPIPPEWEHFKATVGAWLDDSGKPPLDFRGLDFRGLDFRGCSVTIPHKAHLLRFVRERGSEAEPLAERIGAANTLTVREVSGPDPSAGLYASNTDCLGALDAVCGAMGIGHEGLKGRRIAVIGAGGAAAAVVAGFAEQGTTIVVYNRTIEKAEHLAARFDGAARQRGGRVIAAPLANLCKSCCELYVNCTPIGMHPHVDQSPVSEWPRAVGEGTVVFDTIYNPPRTRMLRDAAARGARTVGGAAMFIRQAAAQFELWTGRPAPLDLFERILREELGGEGD